MAKVLKYVLGLDAANRFDSFSPLGLLLGIFNDSLRWITEMTTWLIQTLIPSLSVNAGTVILRQPRRDACSVT